MVSGSGVAQRGLGGSAGYGEITLPRSDDGSLRLDGAAVFGQGLHFFGQSYTAQDIFVNTNGTLSFGAALAAYPGAGLATALPDMIAPFWADVDTRLRGEGVESGEIHVDIDPVADCISVTWDNVGVYRRNTDLVNRFQVQLQDRGGGDFDIVLRYEAIGWTSGSSIADTGAQALLASQRLLAPVWLRPGVLPADLATLDTALGNTGIAGLWLYQVRGGTVAGVSPARGVVLMGTPASDTLQGGSSSDILTGLTGADVLRGDAGADTLQGGDGPDTLNGGEGDDVLFGGATVADLRDVIYGGAGHDRVDAGYGNDLAFAGTGNDIVEGGFGADELNGQQGNDTLSGGALSDLIYGGDGFDFLNGGFGHDRLNGGLGGDRFYHLGVRNHGSDWVQDYSAAQGDVLVFGGAATAVRGDFQINYAQTPGAGAAAVAEAFVIYRPSGQILWALVDGAAQAHITLLIGGQSFDLMA